MNDSAAQKTLFPRDMNERIQKALLKQFSKHRIVFWYDAEKELRGDFELLELPEVEKVEIVNNEFILKYRMLREQPETKFLVYKEGAQPPDLENWLLDVELAHVEFRTDQAALWLAELELGYEFADLVKQHKEFFKSQKRRDALKSHLSPHDTLSRVRLNMLAVCAGSDARLDSVLEYLLDEYAYSGTKDSTATNLIERSNLNGFLWDHLAKIYGYESDSPGVKDFVIELFKSCYAMGTDGEVHLNAEALVFLKRWKDSNQHGKAFVKLSAQSAKILSIEADLNQRDYRDIVELDYFELIDRKVLSDLASQVQARTLPTGECTQYIRGRRSSRWYQEYSHVYEAIDHGSQFLQALDAVNLEIESLEQGLAAYVGSLFRVDQLYRKFIYHLRRSGQVTLLEPLAKDVRNHYTNSFLRPLGDRWQEKVDQLESWQIPNAQSQDRFFDHSLKKPFLEKGKKIFVIISDALRYEVAEELASIIRQEDRYEADLTCAVTKLPSYTQLGMAALLPNSSLKISDDKMGVVEVDGQSSQGTVNRGKLLSDAVDGKGMAIKSDELLAKTGEECRQLTKDHNVIYVYQNRIDKVGHNRDSEQQAFAAVEDALEELVKIVKKLSSANANNIIITADHGFIYQDEVVGESDFSIADPSGDLLFTDRRFMCGRNMEEVDGVKKFTAEQLGLAGDVEVIVPKSINRFRKSGAATRFLHGGCTLQEIVVPVMAVSKRRTSDVSQVNVEMIASSTSVISSGQLAVAFYQVEPVTDKVQARTLSIGIYTSTGVLISDQAVLNFDLTSENPRERELKARLVLSRTADNYNQQEVMLRLEEPVAGTSHFIEYRAIPYTLRRTFTSDFDF